MPNGFLPDSVLRASKAPLPLIPRCGACGLWKQCQSPKMPVDGKGKLGVLVVGEGPGCVSGDTLVEVAFRDKSQYPNGVPIRDLVGRRDFFVYSFDVDKESLVLGRVTKVWKTGRKKVFRVTYEWFFANGKKLEKRRNSIIVTENHPFLLKKPIKHDPFSSSNPPGVTYLSLEGGLEVGHGIQPFHRRNQEYSFVGSAHKKMVKEARFLLEHKLGRVLKNDLVSRKGNAIQEECHHRDGNKLNDSWDNLEPLATDDHARHHMVENNPMDCPEVRSKHLSVVRGVKYRNRHKRIMKRVLANPKIYKERLEQIQKSNNKRSETVRQRFQNDPEYYYRYLLGKCAGSKKKGKGHINNTEGWVERKFKERFPNSPFPPVDNHKVVSIEYVGVEDVYDMEVETYHNFAANGIFIHNSKEDEQNKPFVGKAGRYLRDACTLLGIDLNRDCWIYNSVICRPTQLVKGVKRNRAPTDKEVEYCRPNVIQMVQELKPKVIILLGAYAVKSVLGWLWKEDTGAISRWLGWTIPCQKINAWICPANHPSYCMRQESPTTDKIFQKHLEKAFSKETRPWRQVPDYQSMVQPILIASQAAQMIQEVINMGKVTAFDYEAEALKPDSQEVKLTSCALANGVLNFAYPWMEPAITATKKFLRSPIPKVAANLKYEHRWTAAKLGLEVRNWVLDTMVAAHVLDNRPGIASLKFQSFVRLGQASYDDHIKPYLQAKGNNLPNRIREIDMRQLLTYNALDALLELELAKVQAKDLGITLEGADHGTDSVS